MGCFTSGIILFVIFIILDLTTNYFVFWVHLYGENMGCLIGTLVGIFVWILINKLIYHIKRDIKNKQKYNLYIDEKNYRGIASMHESGEYVDNFRYAVARASIGIGISKEQVKREPLSYMDNMQKIEDIMRTNNYYNNYNFEFLYNKGVCCFYLGKFSEAIKYFDEALALKKDPRIFYNRALCRFKLKDIPNALKDFQIATKDKEIFKLPNVQECKNFVDKIYGDI